MPRAARITTANACYHVITRGNQKQSIFLHTEDYEKYLGLLNKYKKRYNCKLYCFCLMPNHVHLIIEVKNSLGLSQIMRCLNLSYALYFNAKYEKVGHLWQDRFKSRLIEKDSYLIDCIKYIESNPVRSSLVNQQDEYLWSSCRIKDILDNLFAI